MASRLRSAVTTAVLGPPGRQRVRASQSLLALVVYALFAGLQGVGVGFGMVAPGSSAPTKQCIAPRPKAATAPYWADRARRVA